MDNLLELIFSKKCNWEKRFIKDEDTLKNIVKLCKENKKRVVLTQGVYDLIHEGHALYLEKAREYGDLLIVAVDSDELTKQRKGPGRPIVPQEERIKMLAHLRHVDILTLREVDKDIGHTIRMIQPDVLIVSESTKDFTDRMVEEYKDVCGKIVCLPPQSTTSTTARVRDLTIEGAYKLSEEINRITEDFMKKIKGQK